MVQSLFYLGVGEHIHILDASHYFLNTPTDGDSKNGIRYKVLKWQISISIHGMKNFKYL